MTSLLRQSQSFCAEWLLLTVRVQKKIYFVAVDLKILENCGAHFFDFAETPFQRELPSRRITQPTQCRSRNIIQHFRARIILLDNEA